MTEYPSLVNISVSKLVEHAGGDPWAIDQTLQDGDPGEIAELSRAFYNAGACTSETTDEFDKAQQRFKEAWNHGHGDHPINDSAEVQRAINGLNFERKNLPVVAAKLAGLAASLAEAQRTSAQWLDSLDSSLVQIDAAIGQGEALHQDVSALDDQAIDETTVTLKMIEGFRNTYSTQLETTLTTLRVDCRYDPAINDVDGDNSEPTALQRGRTAVEYYEKNQKAADEELVDSGGPMTKEMADAQARLRDYATVTNTDADLRARELAGERLDAFQMSKFVGPLPVDPILGVDARQRALTRLDMQRALESGKLGLPPMTPDQATDYLDEGEHFARVINAEEAVKRFTGLGMSPAGARRAVDLLAKGTPLRELLEDDAKIVGGGEAAVSTAERTVSTGRHALDGFSKADLEALNKIGKKLKYGGWVLEGITGVRDVWSGEKSEYEVAGRVVGGMALGRAASVASAAALGGIVGPEGAALAAAITFVVLSDPVSDAGEWLGKQVENAVN